MAIIPPVVRSTIIGAWSLFAPLLSPLPWIFTLLLLSSPSAASAQAQTHDAPEPTVEQQLEAQPPVSSPDSTANVRTKRKKSATKYDLSRIGHRGIGGGINLYSLERESELGQELAQGVDTGAKFIRDPVITAFVNRLGQEIVSNSDAQLPFTIKVIESDEIDTFALPGGHLYVNSGLILAADSQAEFAALMAHEIAHVAARHTTRAETRMWLLNVSSIALMYFGGPAAAIMRGAAAVAAPVSFLKFTRDAEREADLLGLEYEYATGYDPEAFVQISEKLNAQEKQTYNFIDKTFATHLMTKDRIKRVQEEISSLLPARDEYVVDTSEFQEVKSRLAKFIGERRPSEDGRPILHRRIFEDGRSGGEKTPTLQRKTE